MESTLLRQKDGGLKLKILHFWSKGNLVGDFFYTRAQQAILKELLGDVEIWEGCCARHKLEDKGILREDILQPADLVIVGGGPLYWLFSNNGNLFFKEQDLVDCKKPILVWSTGMDTFLDNKNNPICRNVKSVYYADALHRVAKSAAVRDVGTQTWLKKRGFASVVAGDAAHFLVPLEPVKMRPGPILFSYRHDACEPITETLITYFNWLDKHRLKFYLICSDKADRDSAEKLGYPIYYTEPSSIEEYIKFIGKSGCVLGCRMHIAIVALTQGIPSHCFYFSSRIKFWGDDFFGKDKWLLPLSEVSVDRLCSITEQLLSGKTSVFDPFTSRVVYLKQVTYKWLGENLNG